MTGKKKCYTIFRAGKGKGNYRPVDITMVLRKIMEQFLMKTVYWHMKNKHLNNQHGSSKSKPCLTILIDFCDERTGFVEGEERENLRKAFDTVSCVILVAK